MNIILVLYVFFCISIDPLKAYKVCTVAYKPPFDMKILNYCYNAVIDCDVFACAVLVLLVIVYMRCLQHPAAYGSGLDQHDDVRENIIHYDEEGVGECGRCL